MALVQFSVKIIDYVNNPNNLLADHPIEIRTDAAGSPLASIFQDEDGLLPITQPGAITNSIGVFQFYADTSSTTGYISRTVINANIYEEKIRSDERIGDNGVRPTVYQSVDAMKTDPTLGRGLQDSSTQKIDTERYYLGADGGNASYSLKTFARATADGDVYSPTSLGNIQCINGVAVLQSSYKTVNIEKFGAVNGQNSYDSIVELRDILHSKGGGEILIPGSYIADGIKMKKGVSIVGISETLSRITAPANSVNRGVIELSEGQVNGANIKKIGIRSHATNPNQWGIFADAVVSGGVGGWWQSKIEQVDIRDTNFGIHLKGGVTGSNIPHQFLTFSDITVKRNNFNGESFRCSGQVDQIKSINCIYDAVAGTTLGINVILNANGAANPGSTIDFDVCTIQNSNVGLSTDGYDNVSMGTCWFENINTAITTSNVFRSVSVRDTRFANAGLTQILSLTGTGNVVFENNYMLGTANKLATVGQSVSLQPKDNFSESASGLVTTGATKQINVSSNAINVQGNPTIIVNTSVDEIANINSDKLPGESIFVKPLGGTIIFNSTGNIRLGDQSSPFTLDQNKIAQFVKFDLSGEWQLVGM